MHLGENNILLVEGIHALNPALTEQIADDKKFKIYASALTTILLDDHTISQQPTIDCFVVLFAITSIVVVLHKKQSTAGQVYVLVRTSGFSLIKKRLM